MYNISQLKDFLKEKKMDEKFSSIYGNDAYSISEAYNRLSDTIKHFESIEKTQEIYVFSASGRTELSGNHTDHNNGCVLTASINSLTVSRKFLFSGWCIHPSLFTHNEFPSVHFIS